MSYALFSQAKEWVEPGLGECNAVKQARAVNIIRQNIYNWYSEIGLFMDAVQCFAVQRFYLDCNDCRHFYRGVTLPRDFLTVEAMWYNDFPVRLQSSWREWQRGLSTECDCRLTSYQMPGYYCSALDANPLAPVKLRVKCFEAADIGKRFVLRGLAADGQPFEQTFSLTTSMQETNRAVRALDAQGGVIKDVTAGRVVLMEGEARVLSIYEGDETVPGYRRIKIAGLGEDCSCVNIRASRRYFPLVADDDVVETDNAVAFDAMARYLRLYEKSDKSRDDLINEKNFLANAKMQMMGEKSRELGKATQASITVLTPRFGVMSSRGHRFGRGYRGV